MTATASRRPPGRRSRARRQGGSRVLGALVGLVLLGGAVGLQTRNLTPNEMDAPITTVGAKGQEVNTGRFAVRVNSVAVARAVQGASGKVETEQLFLIVQASATSATKPIHLGTPALLTSDGVSYDATDKIEASETLANPWVQPGFWVSGNFVFEIPASALEGARVVFKLPGSALVEPFEPEAEVDLGLDGPAAAQLKSAPSDVYILKKS
ncbi:hypothetical protein AB0L53_53950 [Nonomuraea sp. NPDC052129]|uniref:hypothetical protein n=1 Tax=Nonomuraea sp. NPDC052129 TaxID=3154651 RepID=UPI0034355E5E